MKYYALLRIIALILNPFTIIDTVRAVRKVFRP